MKIGILGGTFDPIHAGHMALAQAAKDQFELDKVLFVPAFIPPHKTMQRDLTPAPYRYRMVEMALRDHPGFAGRLPLYRVRPALTILESGASIFSLNFLHSWTIKYFETYERLFVITYFKPVQCKFLPAHRQASGKYGFSLSGLFVPLFLPFRSSSLSFSVLSRCQ